MHAQTTGPTVDECIVEASSEFSADLDHYLNWAETQKTGAGRSCAEALLTKLTAYIGAHTSR